jgi:hypothetical protein
LCFFVVTPWQIGVILTANYAFLNYLVLVLALFLLDDAFLASVLPSRWREKLGLTELATFSKQEESGERVGAIETHSILHPDAASVESAPQTRKDLSGKERLRQQLHFAKVSLIAVLFAWLFYASTLEMIWMILPGLPLPTAPVVALEPLRIAERYGLFAVMTPARYEIEFQGSNDGKTWVAYPFRFKPQDVRRAPGIYAPYQPRFDWNLWFASLGEWRANPMVPRTEKHLLQGDVDVLALFAANPFPDKPPKQVHAVLWQYWFTTMEEKRATGVWWRREFKGLYAPTLELEPNGKLGIVDFPSGAEPPAPEPEPQE